MIKSGTNEALRIVVSGYEGVAVTVACSVASMQNQVWTGNLTVGTPTGTTTLSRGYLKDLYGTLSDTTFTFNSNSYTVNGVQSDGSILGVSLDTGLGTDASNLVLHVGNNMFAFSAAIYQMSNQTYAWTTNVPTWTASDSVCLALTEEVASTDATLSALALSGVTLSPAFDADTETYTASVANSVATTTVTAMATDAVATVAVTPSTDADAVTSGHQVNLGVGPTTITATVTAEDGMTTKTYTVVVTRAAQTCTVPTGGIWGACLTAATISIGSTFDTSLPLTGLGCRTTSCGDTSVLTSRDFSFGGKNYRIEAVDLRGGTLEFNLLTPNANTAAADFSSVVLHVGTLSYSLASASFVGNSEAFAWTNTGLSWSANDKVALQLTELASTNAPPAFSAATATRSVPENSPASTNVGAPVTATDGDNDPLAYSLEGTAAAAFEIVSTSGQIRTTTGVTYDHEAQSSYAVTLKADDGNGGTDTIAVTITLTNVIEPPGRPAAPSVSPVAGSTPSLSVSWTAPSNTGPAIDNYDLRYREGTGGSWTTGPQNVSGTSATIAGLTANTLYQVQVLATNAEGDSPWSPSGSGQTSALGAPDVPHSLDATPGNRQVMLGWVQPSGGSEVTDYEYEQDGSGTWISTGGTATDYTVRNLTNGQPYTFRVRAVNSAGASAASAASPSVTPATEPDAPTGLGATVSDRRVDLMWTAPASNGGQSITDYEYEQGGSGTWISTGSTATSYMVHNLTNGQPYRFRVRAVNSVGAGAASAASPNITPATEPDAPTGLSATVSDQRVDLIWTAPASNGGATILRYEYELDFSGTWTSTGGTASSTTVTGLTNGQFYTFRVRAVNRVGESAASGSQSATPTSTVVAPDAPFGLSATPGNRQVMLSWVQPSGGAALTHYEYELDGSETWTSTGGTAPSTR